MYQPSCLQIVRTNQFERVYRRWEEGEEEAISHQHLQAIHRGSDVKKAGADNQSVKEPDISVC